MHKSSRALLVSLAQIAQFLESSEAINEQPEPHLQYLIYFTPRSGSSWLTELLAGNYGFGQPDEWFNPALIPGTAASLGVNNAFDFVATVRRRFSDPVAAVFGAELTYDHLVVMRELTDFLAHFPQRKTRHFFLDRRNTVAQAISMYRAVKSGVFHATETLGKAPAVPYDEHLIELWYKHIDSQRKALSKFFQEQEVLPIALYYEDLIAQGPAKVLDTFSTILHGKYFEGQVVHPSKNRKLGGSEAIEWEERFRASRPDVLAAAGVYA